MFEAWTNYYVIAGSAAAALTGLTFIVITLVSGNSRIPGGVQARGVSTFTTPTVVHFSMALFASLTMAAPWKADVPPALLLGVGGLSGVIYCAVLFYHMSHMHEHGAYEPVLEDWAWYVFFPFAAYVGVLAGGGMLAAHAGGAFFVIAVATALFIFIGIHNSWDIVTYVTIRPRADEPAPGDEMAQRPTA